MICRRTLDKSIFILLLFLGALSAKFISGLIVVTVFIVLIGESYRFFLCGRYLGLQLLELLLLPFNGVGGPLIRS